MSSGNFYRSNQFIWSSNHEQGGDWATVHDSTYARGGAGENTNLRVEVYKGNGSYDIYRAGATYDTSSIPSNATIHSATLHWFRTREWNGQWGQILYIQKMSDSGVSTGYYNQTYFTTLLASWDSGCPWMTEVKANAYVDIGLNVAGITKAGTTRLGFRLQHDYSNSAPGNDGNTVSISGSDWNASQANQTYLTVTWSVPATVTTGSATSIEGTTATLAGTVTGDGGGTISERGVCWGTTLNPTTANSKAIDADNTISVGATGLQTNTVYHYRAYVTTENSTQYGADQTFQTDSIPWASTQDVTDITASTATGNGTITTDGNGVVSEVGVVAKTSTGPTLSDLKFTGSGAPSFTVSMTSLAGSTKYYVKAFVTTGVGTGYGDEVTFVTLPTITTGAITKLSVVSATAAGNVTSPGSEVTERGVCISRSATPTTADTKFTTTGTSGAFTVDMTGLTPGVAYHLRAYATNASGTVYGNEVDFQTYSPALLFLSSL